MSALQLTNFISRVTVWAADRKKKMAPPLFAWQRQLSTEKLSRLPASASSVRWRRIPLLQTLALLDLPLRQLPCLLLMPHLHLLCFGFACILPRHLLVFLFLLTLQLLTLLIMLRE